MTEFNRPLLASVLLLCIPTLSVSYLEEEEEAHLMEGFRKAYAEELTAHGVSVDPAELTASLRDSRSRIREAAAFLLGFYGSLDVVTDLQYLLKDEDPDVRWAAVESLVRIGDPAGFFGALDLLGREQQVMRGRLLQLLAKYREYEDLRPRVIERLKGALDDHEPNMRSTAASLLEELLDVAALSILENALQDEEDPKVRWTLEFLLERLRSRQRDRQWKDED